MSLQALEDAGPTRGRPSLKFKKRIRAQDKMFQRHLKAVMNGDRPDLEGDNDAVEFINKYNTSQSHRVKKQLRDMWRLADEDFGNAGVILSAKKQAFKETSSESSWLSYEQLVDEFKNKEHAGNFMGFCKLHGLVKFDPKRRCKVYYYTKQLVKVGERDEATKERTWEQNGEDASALDEESDV